MVLDGHQGYQSAAAVMCPIWVTAIGGPVGAVVGAPDGKGMHVVVIR